MGLLSKDFILKTPDLPAEDVDVPEWGGTVRVRMLTAAERDAWEAASFGGETKNLQNVRARLVVLCAVDGEGKRLFTDADAAALGNKSGAALDRLFEAAMTLSKLRKADAVAEKKSSDDSPANGSCSDSVSNWASPTLTT